MLGLLLLKNQSYFLINFIENAKATEAETRAMEGQKSNCQVLTQRAEETRDQILK